MALALGATLATGGRLDAQGTARVAVETDIGTSPVEIDGAVLFRLRGVSSLPSAERARLVADRIVAAAADPAVTIESIRVVEADSVHAIVAGDSPLVGVFDADADMER